MLGRCNFTLVIFLILNLSVGFGSIYKSERNDDSKIINGQTVSILDRPYQVRLFYNNTKVTWFQCGGAIISKDWVLTAAHCVETIYPRNFTIEAGKVENRTVSRIIRHPQSRNYTINETKLGYDYALVQVAIPFSIGQPGIQAITLANSLPSAGTTVTASGYGWTSFSNPPDQDRQLKKADMKMMRRFFCWLLNYQTFLDNRGNEKPYYGDSGGPATLKTSSGDELVGIVSRGSILARFGWPDVFASVPFVRSWIRDTTGI